MNQHIQAAVRRPEGALSAVGKRLSVPLSDGSQAKVGDQIAARRNLQLETDRGVPVRNRHTWTVTAIDPDRSLTVTNPDQGTVTLPADYVAGAVELGWAVTGYGNQGIATDHSITVIEPTATRAGVYVGLARGRHTNTVLIPDATGTLDPADALAQVISRPDRVETAHAVRARLHHQHGQEPPAPEAVRIEPPAPIGLTRPGPDLEL